jgi:hypothetical protein
LRQTCIQIKVPVRTHLLIASIKNAHHLLNANSEIVSRKRIEVAVHFADKTGDITVVQTKNANLTKNVETERNSIYNKWTRRFLTVDTVLAPTDKCVDTRMSLRQREDQEVPVPLLQQ